FDVFLPANMDVNQPHIYIRSQNGGAYYLEMNTDKPLGCAMKIDRLLEQLNNRAAMLREQIYRVEKQKAEAIADIETGNSYQTEVDELLYELIEIDADLSEIKPA
ncbi:MAG: hypothetical protein ACI4DY_02090, partial [Monoglobaceae bacterium]